MAAALTSLEALLHPLSRETFFAEYYGRQPLHVPGTPDKAAAVFSWDDFIRLLDMTGIWTAASLKLKLDRRDVSPQVYCTRTVDRNQQTVWQPDPARVMDLARRGASLICNQIETLTPGVRAVLQVLERAFAGRSSCNIYCSWKDRQAFDSHYDKHEVFVLFIAGEKVWRLYEGRMDQPVQHAFFANQTQAFLDSRKGRVAREITTRPGDVLYIPRGQFHDALASDAASLHLTFALVVPNGLNVLTDAWERAVSDPLFRADLPVPAAPDYEERLAAHVQALVARFADVLGAADAVDHARRLQRDFPVARPAYDLRPEAGAGAPPADLLRYRPRR